VSSLPGITFRASPLPPGFPCLVFRLFSRSVFWRPFVPAQIPLLFRLCHDKISLFLSKPMVFLRTPRFPPRHYGLFFLRLFSYSVFFPFLATGPKLARPPHLPIPADAVPHTFPFRCQTFFFFPSSPSVEKTPMFFLLEIAPHVLGDQPLLLNHRVPPASCFSIFDGIFCRSLPSTKPFFKLCESALLEVSSPPLSECFSSPPPTLICLKSPRNFLDG